MKFGLSGLKDLKTTVIGIIIIAGATYALVTKACTFDQWWEIVLIALALIGGTGALLAKAKDGK